MPNYLAGQQDDLYSLKRFGSSFTDAILGAAAARAGQQQREFENQMQGNYLQLARDKDVREASESGSRVKENDARTGLIGGQAKQLADEVARQQRIGREAAWSQLGIGSQVPTDEGRQGMMAVTPLGLRDGGDQMIGTDYGPMTRGVPPIMTPTSGPAPVGVQGFPSQIPTQYQGGINDILRDPKILMQLSSDLGQTGLSTTGGIQDPNIAMSRIIAALHGDLFAQGAGNPASAAGLAEPMTTRPGDTIRNPLNMDVLAHNPQEVNPVQQQRVDELIFNDLIKRAFEQQLLPHRTTELDARAKAEMERADKAKNNSTGGQLMIGGLGDLVKQSSSPKQGEVVKGYRFIGGDPSKKESWEKVQ